MFALVARKAFIVVTLLGFAACALLTGCNRAADPEATIKRAQSEVAKGDYPAAMRDLKTVLERQPDHAGARSELARVSFALGDLEAAQKELDRALAAGADAGALRPLQIDILLARGQYDEARKILDADKTLPPVLRLTLQSSAQLGLMLFEEAEHSATEALHLAPADSQALYALARAQAGQNHDDQALQTLETAVAGGHASTGTWLMRGHLLAKRGQLDQARDTFRKGLADIPPHAPRSTDEIALRLGLGEANLALGDLPGAEAAVKDLDKRSPGSVASAYLRGRIAIQNRDFHTASNELRRALQSAPNFTEARILLGRSLFMEGNLEQADSELSQVLATDHDNVEAQKALAQVNLARNRPEEARQMLDQVSPAASQDAQLDWLMGSALLQLGSSQEGIARLEKSVAAVPGDNALRIQLAQAYVAAGRNADAVALLEKLPPAARDLRAGTVLLAATVAGKSSVEAQEAIEKLLAAHAGDAALWTIAGEYQIGRSEALARQYLDKSIALDPKNIEGRLGLAQLAARKADSAAAQRELRAVLALDPKNERAFAALAGLDALRGDHAAARKTLEGAIAANPASVKLRLLLAQLAFGDSDPQRAHALLDQATSIATNRGEVLNAVGELLLRVGSTQEALERFQDGAKAGSQAAVLNTARAQLALKRESDARATLESAYSATPRSLRAGVMLVQLDAETGHATDAHKRIEQLKQVGLPAFAAAEMSGDVEMAAKRYDAAYNEYSKAAAGRASAALALKMYRARVTAGKADATESLEHWLTIEPNDRMVRLALAESLQSQRKVPEAIKQYERLAASGDAVGLNNLAWLYHQTGDKRALETAQRAYQLSPRTPEIADTYGWLLVESGDIAGGTTLLEQASAARPNNRDLAYHLAATRARAGDKNKAASMLKALLEKPGAFESRDSAERLLQALNK
jgi:putative PEP-CTERM system TPR-repeat lipoprotein